MKCPNCGAEIGNNNFCEYCGTQVSLDMKKEQEQLNRQGCPKCGSTNIQFKRENQGEIRGKNSKQIIHRTVGFCKDCGHTWYPDSGNINAPQNKRTWLWVLGWICIFPLPLTIILLRKKNIKPVIKYGIITAAWILYLIIALSGNSSSNSSTSSSNSTKQSEEKNETRELVDSGSNEDVKVSEENIKKLEFLSKNIEIKVGEKDSSSWMRADVRDSKAFSSEDVVFVSGDESIAVIHFSREAMTTYLYYEVEGITQGKTYVYAKSKDGTIESEHIPIIVEGYVKGYEDAASKEETVKETNYSVDMDNPIKTNSLQDLFISLPQVTDGRDEIDFYLKEYKEFTSHKFTGGDEYYIGLTGSAVSSRPRDRSGDSIVIYFTKDGNITKATYTNYPGQVHVVEYRNNTFYFDGEACESGEYAMQLYLLNR